MLYEQKLSVTIFKLTQIVKRQVKLTNFYGNMLQVIKGGEDHLMS